MARSSEYLVAFLVAAALGTGAWLYWRSSDSQRIDDVSIDDATPRGATRIAQMPSRPSKEGSRSNNTDERTSSKLPLGENSQVIPAPSSDPGAPEELTTAAKLRAATADLDGLSVPDGAPFPIAVSIEKECEAGEDLYFNCSGVQKVLKTIADERRDTQWAPSMEARIRTVVGASPGVHIRALACRSSVCAVEFDGALLLSPAFDPLSTDLRQASYVRAREPTGNPGQTIRVQLWTFTRRSAPTR
jgi:hypothetical protein